MRFFIKKGAAQIFNRCGCRRALRCVCGDEAHLPQIIRSHSAKAQTMQTFAPVIEHVVADVSRSQGHVEECLSRTHLEIDAVHPLRPGDLTRNELGQLSEGDESSLVLEENAAVIAYQEPLDERQCLVGITGRRECDLKGHAVQRATSRRFHVRSDSGCYFEGDETLKIVALFYRSLYHSSIRLYLIKKDPRGCLWGRGSVAGLR
ncbi:MAG: hypothetical protein COW24_04325 [Candidatus Kerfeldbacteria bacterium CG15_BIG_FIL_POST_REV_8_21_14_020_45_12]|uniref:Uncharacterized protein n=1 Tax=Candidatus Kerfeldbacteria bacterium CG15_BIG_FIL_POST_REV_8_21_14_020_45_12 TaxID=2014247 RepID=A0A2M7H349_9BACT|nr:MAG: hypothetical protein COW24_04325 [Candidatus Kerfeldbacteria bacterium CG15_BIG_FIL_POST_REV_8_21_14_020_45_12]PJA93298.1 MAG: hypothetical protein CO132_03660 [Candidatus Kerfeldbacteria bacterium CG_4_9_14_3_um_filter_45_8]